MGSSARNFTKFINIALKVLISLIVISSFIKLIDYCKNGVHPFNMAMILVFIASAVLLYMKTRDKYNKKIVLSLILLGALLIRIAWILSINSRPISDFRIIYESGSHFLEGNYNAFKGTGYIARFPHLTVLVLYFAFIQKFFAYPLMVIKIFNALFSTLNVLFIYLIAKEVFNNERKALWGAFITALYPPLITYVAVYCTENIAIPFYLASVYCFILVMKRKKKDVWLLLSALLLSIGNLFRMVAPVMVIAYLMYLFIYAEKKFKEKGKSALYIIGGFLIPLILVSNFLRALDITEFQLWKGSEPSWTSVLKGTNIEHGGRWNEEDAALPDKYDGDYEKVEKAAKEIIKHRLTSTPKGELAKFYARKYIFQWIEGDFSGTYWAKEGVEEKDIKIDLEKNAVVYMQMFYCILLLLTYKGLFNKKQYLDNPIINLFYIIFCGYGLLYLITESQDRYSFIVCWLFLILALTVGERTKLWKD